MSSFSEVSSVSMPSRAAAVHDVAELVGLALADEVADRVRWR